MTQVKMLMSVGVVCLLFSGCSTQPVSDQNAERVAPLFQSDSPDAAVIIVTRDRGLQGSGSDAYLALDGKRAANLRPGQQVRLTVSPGEHVATVGSYFDHGTSAVEFHAEPRGERRYRILVAQMGSFTIVPVH